MRFTREELETFRDSTVPDLIGDDCKLLFVGINPGLWTAATKTHFCHPSNRFYPAMRQAGLIDFVVDTDGGMTEEQRREFTGRGMGVTNLVPRATIRADELSREELVAGGAHVEDLVGRLQPNVVAVVGVTAYRAAFGQRAAKMGRQDSDIAGSETWALPNPSGLNAHVTVDDLAGWFSTVAQRAGIS